MFCRVEVEETQQQQQIQSLPSRLPEMQQPENTYSRRVRSKIVGDEAPEMLTKMNQLMEDTLMRMSDASGNSEDNDDVDNSSQIVQDFGDLIQQGIIESNEGIVILSLNCCTVATAKATELSQCCCSAPESLAFHLVMFESANA